MLSALGPAGHPAGHFLSQWIDSTRDRLPNPPGAGGGTSSSDCNAGRSEPLAKIAGMGVSTLHHHFRALTAMSPLQYQKQLRLHAARERMLMDGMDTASAAFEVGYESASQFNREYSRFFGQPPMRDIRTLRSPSALSLESVSSR